jgi:hypothetical protein
VRVTFGGLGQRELLDHRAHARHLGEA